MIFAWWSSEPFEDLIYIANAWLSKSGNSRQLEGVELSSVETCLGPNCITAYILPWVRTKVYLG